MQQSRGDLHWSRSRRCCRECILIFQKWITFQLWLHRLHLIERYPECDHVNTVTAYDDGCHWWSYVTNPVRKHACPTATIPSKQDVVIDNFHLKGHVDPNCKKQFNANKHPIIKDVNTQVAEQIFSWFSMFKHIGRYMIRGRYWIFVLGLLNGRNKITLGRLNEWVRKKNRQ